MWSLFGGSELQRSGDTPFLGTGHLVALALVRTVRLPGVPNCGTQWTLSQMFERVMICYSQLSPVLRLFPLTSEHPGRPPVMANQLSQSLSLLACSSLTQVLLDFSEVAGNQVSAAVTSASVYSAAWFPFPGWFCVFQSYLHQSAALRRKVLYRRSVLLRTPVSVKTSSVPFQNIIYHPNSRREEEVTFSRMSVALWPIWNPFSVRCISNLAEL